MSSTATVSEAARDAPCDLESQGQHASKEQNSLFRGLLSFLAVKDGEVYEAKPDRNPKWYQKLLDAGVEENGIKPVPIEQRTSTQYSNLFTVFFTCLLCLLPIPTGMLATLGMGLSLRDASLIILFFALLTCIPPAFMGIGGMETGLRQLVQARYSFGLYLVTIPLLLNAATLTGFSLLSSVGGGQALSSLSPAKVSVDVGIVIACLVSFAVSLLGFHALHFWERWTWVPNLIAIVITVGCGAVPNVPAWDHTYHATGIGGVMAEMLAPAGGFGRFVLVMLALSVIGNMAISMYSVALNLQMLLPCFARVPRFVFMLVAVAVMVPMAIRAAEAWEESLTNFLAVIGYWAGCFDAVLIVELVVFRRMDYSTFDHGIWNVGRKLPPGIAAMAASLVSLGLVVPGMAAPSYTGPIAKRTGDIGFEVAFVMTALSYLPFRWLEIRWRGRL
ncbi:NCS1 nucleoside transporter [Chaetomidium leptoderma]|uniref:NCS1 nucleoside transporter n=1 Tax=Chaetomidium leptoderma TaxID=669021 RepID=A0AAN6ZYB9_9PEZI|nr:NCS1 nucleoside transporter [Chaetomidium leptoderma]